MAYFLFKNKKDSKKRNIVGRTVPPPSLTWWAITIRFLPLQGWRQCLCLVISKQLFLNELGLHSSPVKNLKVSSGICFLARVFGGWSELFSCFSLTNCHSHLTMSSLHQRQKKKEWSRLQGYPGLLLENRCPDSDNTFLPPASSWGEKNNGSGHLERNVSQFSSITHSDAHICQTSPSQLPTDPSACLDMMRSGVQAPFKACGQTGPPSALEKCSDRMLSLSMGTMGLHRYQPLLSWEVNEQTQSRSPSNCWLSWPQTYFQNTIQEGFLPKVAN